MKKKFPYYQQLDSMDCDSTCIRMVAKYYGCSYSLQTLRKNSFFLIDNTGKIIYKNISMEELDGFLSTQAF